ncbi:SRPBCC family protein [Ferruginibacter lapsinanis]|uniref:SRPBCC family protein n=1 Tax=Ferruginibacter lapsinanis TaxID=563172 RepID=UPI001E515F32|nr:SRPBCC family protein [Ferruginibacter lapsinanis]UEG50047.1 SRPBCC family protein [Ferruginibacter lapsinanis]
MKILKRIFIGILVLFALLLIVALFVKKEYTVEREVTIAKPKQEVFNYIKLLKNQSNYSVWVKMDPNAKMEYKGTDGTVGFVSSWDSENKNVGKGEQEIKQITEGERLDLSLHFIKPFEGFADAYMTTAAIDSNQTKVKWGFHNKMKYPLNIICLFMNVEKMIGKDLGDGLNNLKVVLEK